MALKTSFIISCGFDWDRIPRCHFAFFNDAAPVPVVGGVAELDSFLLLEEFDWELFVSIGSNVTLKSFKAKDIKFRF